MRAIGQSLPCGESTHARASAVVCYTGTLDYAIRRRQRATTARSFMYRRKASGRKPVNLMPSHSLYYDEASVNNMIYSVHTLSNYIMRENCSCGCWHVASSWLPSMAVILTLVTFSHDADWMHVVRLGSIAPRAPLEDTDLLRKRLLRHPT